MDEEFNCEKGCTTTNSLRIGEDTQTGRTRRGYAGGGKEQEGVIGTANQMDNKDDPFHIQRECSSTNIWTSDGIAGFTSFGAPTQGFFMPRT
ncbi:unnamed protein product [Protopolystoma xenopodis]|uniref:Uncharacterized protein n=1 Tax=Protopolystoma xenopodis TaxID=117903 RepID=A0A448WAJ8_9PLAT|nr:unnamed protein product [Protopolystoma xenopodis]